MKSLTVKSLVGAAVLASCGLANAATVSITPTVGTSDQYSSIEGNASASAANGSAVVKVPVMTFKVGSTAYNDGDKVIISFGGGVALRQGSVGTPNNAAPVAGTDLITCDDGSAAPGAGVLQFKLLLTAVDSSSATYTIQNRIAGALSANAQCAFRMGTGNNSSFDFLASSLTTTKEITVNWVAQSSTAVVYDSLTDSKGNPNQTQVVHTALSQFKVYAGSSGQTILVNPASALSASGGGEYSLPGGYTFLSSSTSTTAAYSAAMTHSLWSDYIKGITQNVANTQNVLTALGGGFDTVITTYTGDFSFLDSDANGCTLSDVTKTTGYAYAALTGTHGGTISAITSDCTKITVSGATADGTNILTFNVGKSASTNGARPVPAQTVAVATTWSKAGTVVGTGSATASIINNGFTATVNYMPYGPGISRIFYATNRTSNAGKVTLSARNEAGTSCAATNFPSVAIPANGIVSLAAAADAGIAACFGADFNGKVRFDIASTVGAQSTDSVSLTGTVAEMVLGNGAYSNAASSTYTAATCLAGQGALVAAACGPTPVVAGTATATSLKSTGATTITGTVTRAASRVDVYSAYNVNGNRVTVSNSTNGR